MVTTVGTKCMTSLQKAVSAQGNLLTLTIYRRRQLIKHLSKEILTMMHLLSWQKRVSFQAMISFSYGLVQYSTPFWNIMRVTFQQLFYLLLFSLKWMINCYWIDILASIIYTEELNQYTMTLLFKHIFSTSQINIKTLAQTYKDYFIKLHGYLS